LRAMTPLAIKMGQARYPEETPISGHPRGARTSQVEVA
jgi:hypothetical protein